MTLPPKKIEILETLLIQDQPVKAPQIAKEMGTAFRPVMMHLLGLVRIGFAVSPEKSHYTITEKGKEALGLPKTNKENAKAILAHIPLEKTFHFYAGIGKPLDFRATSLRDFSIIIMKVDPASLEFHLCRGDFEAWFTCLGDNELAKKVTLLKQKKVTKEELQERLHKMVETRCIALNQMIELTGKSGNLAIPSGAGTALRVS
jgi:hypothetical protein